tara:strand:+ start:12807 stop:13418 length:612 start_codon:yes stop_codon:yes gene_type:complete
MIGIVDYGLGNIGAIKNILRKIEFDSILIKSPEDFKKIESVILPGVGAFDYGMKMLDKLNFIEPLNKHALVDKKLTVGICLGMQLMMKSSQEGNLPGLGWINDKVIKFKFKNNDHKVPHMGWNYINSNNKVFDNDLDEKRFYFVHSYHVPYNKEICLSTTNYGNLKFCSAIRTNNIFGFQFHPEKSHSYGKYLLKNLFDNKYD